MLFNSTEFLLLFLPALWAVFLGISRAGMHGAKVPILIAGSLLFYSWWELAYLPLILLSIGVNFVLGEYVIPRTRSRSALIAGLAFNLGLLGFFKYADFLVDNINTVGGTFELPEIVLPLAISFFTFQQVGYLVDKYRGGVPRYRLIDYALFVSFFPQLIAGPIVRHAEMLPQFMDPSRFGVSLDKAYRGLLLFTFGLAKKVILADSLSPVVAETFSRADGGASIASLDAWLGALAYTFQLYFDFSGYVDMALGAALLFGISLPSNFDSPYKATSIIDFWRRWHITLSRFLRDYLYIPLGGNRHGKVRRYINLMLTMLLGGLWHGAGWNFVIWGALHGLYLCINNVWHGIAAQLPSAPSFVDRPLRWVCWGLTFLAVVIGWVFFRATTFDGAVRICKAMFSADSSWARGLDFAPTWPTSPLMWLDFEFLSTPTLLALCFGIALLAPRGEDIVERPWARHPLVALAGSALLLVSLWRILFSGVVSEFLYFDF